jgi:hypothetical protein
MSEHIPSNTQYHYGCRCAGCKAAHAAVQKAGSAARAKRLQDADVVHGSASTYRNWHCRCEPCTTAHRLACAEKREVRVARLAADPTLAPHGRSTTYTNWGCRCVPCKDAATVAARSLPSRRSLRP